MQGTGFEEQTDKKFYQNRNQETQNDSFKGTQWLCLMVHYARMWFTVVYSNVCVTEHQTMKGLKLGVLPVV